MEITPKSQVDQIDAYVNQVQQKNKVEGPENQEQADKPAVKTDTVVISDTAKRIQDANTELKAIPDVREDKVAELKSQIENRTYKPDSEEVAGAMLKDALMNDLG
jgi:negative regulator of flagellin synthesis FlgM